MSVIYYCQSAAEQWALYWCDVAFVAIFSAEIALRLLANGARDFYANLWNRLDFVVVFFSLAVLAWTSAAGVEVSFSIGVGFRLLRLTRVFRTIR